MRTVLAVGLLAMCANGAGAQEATAYSSKEGRFGAKFPAQPGTVVTTKAVKVGDIELTLSTSERGANTYSVAYSDLTPAALKDAPAARVLEMSEAGFAAQLKMTVSSAKATTFGDKKYPAREFTGERDGFHVRVVLVLAETRMYQVFVTGPKEAVSSKEAEGFFASVAIN